jgi:hypothetical protein
MFTLEAHSKSGHYIAAVIPIRYDQMEYQVLVFRQGSEVFGETKGSLEEAIQTARAYLLKQAKYELDHDSPTFMSGGSVWFQSGNLSLAC